MPSLVRLRPRGHFTVGDLLERAARKWGDLTCLRQDDRIVTFAELNANANRVANWGSAHGLGKGSAVGLLMENRPEYLATWLGLAKIGAATVLLNTQLRGEALAHSLRTGDCEYALVGRECADAWASLPESARLPEVLWVDDPSTTDTSAAPGTGRSLDEELRNSPTTDPPRELRSQMVTADPLFYIFTSGTTGLPKAARLSHSRFLGGGLYSMMAGLRKGDVHYCSLPLYHTVGGVMCVDAALRSGATLALARTFRASEFWDDVSRYGATSFQYVGELCRYLVNQPPHPLERSHTLRFAVGNGLRPDVWSIFQERFRVPHMVEFYGATESNVAMVNLRGPAGSVGKPPPGVTLALVRHDVDSAEVVRNSEGRCERCGVDEPGELLCRIAQGRSAAGRFEGYTSSDETERKVLRDVLEPGDAWFRTGDLLARDANGYYRFVDRVGDTFRWKGENVSTQELAEAVTGAVGVHLCTAYGVAVPGAEGRAGMVAVTLEPGAELDGAALFAHLEQALPRYARPAFVRVQAEPALTGTFKLRKVELQREGFDPTVVGDPLLYRDDERRAYVPFGPDTVGRIGRGELRF